MMLQILVTTAWKIFEKEEKLLDISNKKRILHLNKNNLQNEHLTAVTRTSISILFRFQN